MSFSDIRVGIVCPMANERDTAVAFVTEVLEVCERLQFRSVTFFAVLDRVSKDGTLDLMRGLAASEPRLQVVWAPENRSVVDAYVTGYRAALPDNDWILEIDAGYSHQPAQIPQFFHRMAEGYDCVFGTRFSGGGSISDSSRRREFISRGGTILANLLLQTPLHDLTSGFQLFTREALATILARGIKSRGPFFQTEMKAYSQRMRIAEVPISYSGASFTVGRKALADAFKNLFALFRLRLQGQL